MGIWNVITYNVWRWPRRGHDDVELFTDAPKAVFAIEFTYVHDGRHGSSSGQHGAAAHLVTTTA